MEQRWMVNSNDVPAGDLEFWAMRRGRVMPPSNPGGCDPAARRRKVLVRAGISVLAAVAIGIAI